MIDLHIFNVVILYIVLEHNAFQVGVGFKEKRLQIMRGDSHYFISRCGCAYCSCLLYIAEYGTD